jgi:hypothetical protein
MRFASSGFNFSRPFKVVVGLKVHPEFRTVAEIQAQAQRSVGRDTPTIIHDLGDTGWRNSDRLRKLAIPGHEFLLEHFAGSDRCEFFHDHTVSPLSDKTKLETLVIG